ncbi:hypothetical protein DBY21_10170 [Candidatus Gastranaerophilales bacterium]|nr:MAG: hypothetical protein DBY21_10170 [Candidatus Gastranaerophilales bacterium]
MTYLMTWNEVEKQLEGECTVLLGNGFSRSYCNSSFNQKEILANMPSLQGLMNVTDIEKCINETQQKVQELYPNTTVPKKIIDKWIKNQLHKEFITVLYDKMPKSLNAIEDYTDEKLIPYRKFFNNFDSIYTLNYDPLLYWMLMRFLKYGDENYIEYFEDKEKLASSDIDSAEYSKLKNNADKSSKKCLKALRAEMYEKYLEKNDNYKLLVSCKGETLLEEEIANARKQFSIKWDKLADGLYNALEKKKEEEAVFKAESQILDNIAKSTLDKKLQEIEANKEELKIKIKDGFNGEVWNEKSLQTIFYLHGAFHLLENQNNVIKLIADNKKMVDKIKEKWDEGYEPLTVLESSAEAKKNRIAQSAYLTKCFNELKNIKGILVTHGLSFMESDQHIIDAINTNDNLEKIYIGVYKTISNEIENAFKNNSKVIYFNSNGMFNN